MDNRDVTPSENAVRALASAPRYKDVRRCYTLTVKLLEGGSTRATVGRLDPLTKRLVFASLPSVRWYRDDEAEAIRCLLVAAMDLHLAQEDQLALF